MTGPDEEASVAFADNSISEERTTGAHTFAHVRRLVFGQIVTTSPLNRIIHDNFKYPILVFNMPSA